MIKSIETEYNGIRFRNRLEARWAVFFDELQFNTSTKLKDLTSMVHGMRRIFTFAFFGR